MTLVAGKNQPVGTVVVNNTTDTIVVTYNVTKVGWVLNETHLEVADNESDIPATRTGNPNVGLFTNSSSHPTDEGVTTVTFTIPKSTIESTDGNYSVAAHATVVNTTADPMVNETAWGDGADGALLADHGSWATYFAYNVST